FLWTSVCARAFVCGKDYAVPGGCVAWGFIPVVFLIFSGDTPATSGHFGGSSFLPSIVSCDGGRVCSSTATSRTAFFGPSSADCLGMSYFPMERLAAPVTE